MDIMDTITVPGNRPVLVTICGDAGVGKTSLAATFPDPIFLRAEDGLQAIGGAKRPAAFPLIETEADLINQLSALIFKPHNYRTAVIDSVTALERLFTAEVLAADARAKSINQAHGGYGAATNMIAARHQRVRRAAGRLVSDRGMNVVFIAHADVETMKLPDQDDYQRWTLKMPPKSQPPYVDDVDVVAFLRLVSYVTGEDGERKKAKSTGAREVICYASAANVSKNRFGIVEPLSFEPGVNPFAGLITGIGKKSYLKPPAGAKVATKDEDAVIDNDDAKPISNLDEQDEPTTEQAIGVDIDGDGAETTTAAGFVSRRKTETAGPDAGNGNDNEGAKK